MSKYMMCFLVVLLSFMLGFAQAPDTLWTLTYGGADNEVTGPGGPEFGDCDVIETSDGGFAAVTYTRSFGAGDLDIYVIRTNDSGDTLWTRTIGGPNADWASAIVQIPDGGFLIGGMTENFGADWCDHYFIRLNAVGDTLWTRVYGTPHCDYTRSVILTSDGGYAAVGSKWRGDIGRDFPVLIKLNTDGSLGWIRDYNEDFSSDGSDLVQLPDDGFAIGGWGDPQMLTSKAMILRTDPSGNMNWVHFYGGDDTRAFSIVSTSDGGFAVTGHSWGNSFFILKTDSEGDSLWLRHYNHGDYPRSHDLTTTSDEGFVVVGHAGYDGTESVLIVKADGSGNEQWHMTLNGPDHDAARAVKQVSDGSFIIAGYTYSYGAGGSDLYLVRTEIPCIPYLTDITVDMDSLTLYQEWRWSALKLTANTTCGSYSIANSQAEWSSSTPTIASVDSDGRITAQTSGIATIWANYDGFIASVTVTVIAPVLPPVHESITSYLSTPAAGYVYEMPVVVLRFLPTSDGVNLDVGWSPDFWGLGEISLADMKQNINDMDRRVKFMLEEGSRFRGFDRPDARPSLGYRVVDYITIYEPLPPGIAKGTSNGYPLYHTDFYRLFERFNCAHYVNDLGVKEFWIWGGSVDASYPCYDPALHTPDRFRGGWESNMSSPTTGDISNSDRDNSDLPIYNSTYMVYGQNLRRSQAEAVHNHGHQLESILSHVNWLQDGNSQLFWWNFSGGDENGFVQGRCGNTEFPPNGRWNYDYENPDYVASDIREWAPEGGPTTMVNVDTWGQHPYEWPNNESGFSQQIESQWYIFWMQAMPGFENGVPYNSTTMTNWWTFTANWDDAINAGMGLYGSQLPIAPEIVIHCDGENAILTWNQNGNQANVNYTVWRATESQGVFSPIATTSDTTWTDFGVIQSDSRQFYYVDAHSSVRVYSKERLHDRPPIYSPQK